MEEAVESGRGRWSTAVGLTFAVLVLSILDTLALVVLPLAILVVALPTEKRGRWVVVGVVLWAIGLILSGGTLALLSRGWALVLGSAFLIVTSARPEWRVVSRALAATVSTLAASAVVLLVTGQMSTLDSTIRGHLATVSTMAIGDLQSRMPDATWLADLRTATEQITEVQATIFPALLALQSIAALALVAWWIRRLGRSESSSFVLAPLKEFRFNDQLIWILIGAVVLLLLPLAPWGSRMALNALIVMAALYALRGLAVFIFLATGSKSVPTMVLGALAFVFLYPVAITAALLMGVGDTWLDVRRRVVTATPS